MTPVVKLQYSPTRQADISNIRGIGNFFHQAKDHQVMFDENKLIMVKVCVENMRRFTKNRGPDFTIANVYNQMFSFDMSVITDFFDYLGNNFWQVLYSLLHNVPNNSVTLVSINLLMFLVPILANITSPYFFSTNKVTLINFFSSLIESKMVFCHSTIMAGQRIFQSAVESTRQAINVGLVNGLESVSKSYRNLNGFWSSLWVSKYLPSLNKILIPTGIVSVGTIFFGLYNYFVVGSPSLFNSGVFKSIFSSGESKKHFSSVVVEIFKILKEYFKENL